MTIPDWYALILLSLAAFRTWKLFAEDDITDRVRGYVTRAGGWKKEGDALPPGYRYGLAEFISCPWCLGAWVSLGIYLFWIWQPHWTLVVSTPLALSAIVAFLAKLAD